jgi:predicted PurR-regulated permease PerM
VNDGRIARPIAIGVALIVAYGVLRAAAVAAPYLLLAFLGVVIATILSFPVEFLARRMPRSAAVLLTLVLVGCFTIGGGILAAPTLMKQIDELSDQLPDSMTKAQKWWRKQRDEGPIAQLPNPGQVQKQVERNATQKVGEVVAKAPVFALTIAEVVTSAVLVVALGFFLAHEPKAYVTGIGKLLPRAQRARVMDTLLLMGASLRSWTGGIFVSMLLMGAFTAAGLAIIGMDAWLTLGLLTFFGTFVPYAGAVASAVPGLALALAHSPRMFWLALVVYLLVHLVEGYIVQPLIMKRAVHLRPALLLVWQVTFGALFGPVGVIVATPVLACLQCALQHLWIDRAELV